MQNRLFFPVSLDGDTLDAFIDTGAAASTIDAKSAPAASLGRGTLGHDPSANLRGVASAPAAFHRHTFGQIVIGAMPLRSPTLIVAPLNLRDADIVLGMDFLAGRRVWFSYGADRIFVAPSR
jgi:predicted aspartyl protease